MATDRYGEGSKATHFQPRQSQANPGGRPKGFAAKIKDLRGDDYEQDCAWPVYDRHGEARGDRCVLQLRHWEGHAKDRIAAFVALRDGGPGRPVQTLEHRGDVPIVTRVIHEEAPVDPGVSD